MLPTTGVSITIRFYFPEGSIATYKDVKEVQLTEMGLEFEDQYGINHICNIPYQISWEKK